MRRLHLLEIHEQPWCPGVIRDAATSYLGFVATVGRQYDRVTPGLRKALEATGAQQIVDLCSGSGGPWPRLEAALNQERQPPCKILLTDRIPHGDATQITNENIRYIDMPVDAAKLPQSLAGFRTLFTSLHHFRPTEAKAIFEDAMRCKQGIAIFEQTERTLPAVLLMLLLPLLVFTTAVFVRPFRWSHLFWSCVIPIVPLVLAFDGIVSCLRTYTCQELLEMIASAEQTSALAPYTWDVGRLTSPTSGIGILYVIGYPTPTTSGTMGPRVARTK